MGGEIPPIFYMGLFGGKKTYVSSTLYNMAGEIEKRPNFLKTLVAGHLITGSNQSISTAIQQGYIRGPGLKLKSFGRWARDNYDLIGVPRANLYTSNTISSSAIAPHIPHDAAETVSVQRVDVKLADYSYWAEQWLFENEPTQIDTEWVANYDDVKNEVTLVLVDGTVVNFTPSNFTKSAAYIYAAYTLVRGQEIGAVESGPVIYGPFPSTAGYDQISNTNYPDTKTLSKIEEKTITYSDNRPSETSTVNTTSQGNYTYYRGVFEKTEYKGGGPNAGDLDQLYSTVTRMYLSKDAGITQTLTNDQIVETIDGGVTKTTKIRTIQDVISNVDSYRIDKQDISRQSRSPVKMFIYKLGSGNAALDAVVSQRPDDGFYFPFIPIRLDNKFLSDNYNPTAYDLAQKAYKKATSGSFDGIVDNLADNKDLQEIDYAYIMFGVSLNTKENIGRKYLYQFFKKLMLTQTTSPSDYNLWDGRQNAFDDATATWVEWREAQDDPLNPLFGTPSPSIPQTYGLPASEVRIRGTGSVPTNLDMQISWQSITETVGTGKRKPDAKKGDYWIEFIRKQSYGGQGYSNGTGLSTDNINVDRLAIHWQVDDNNWRTLNIIGLVHKNYIYQGKFVEIDAEEALKDPEESGFLVPLHYQTFNELSVVDATQLSTACCYLVLNSYKVVKKKWYQTGIFKILLVVAIIAITVATGGAGAAGVGLLGANAAVGAALGLAGTLAIIAGVVANALVAIIVSKLISIGAVAIFGDKLGSIIAAIVTVVTLQVGTSLSNGSSLATSMSNLARADNIIALTSSVGSGIAGYVQAGAIDTINQTQKLQQDYQKQSDDIAKLYEQNIGYDTAQFDPLALNAMRQFNIENADTFLERTLMTGSDIAELSQSLLSNFAEITLSTDLNR